MVVDDRVGQLPAIPAAAAYPCVNSADQEAEQPEPDGHEQNEPEHVGGKPETSEDGQQQEQHYQGNHDGPPNDSLPVVYPWI
jgi:hypothetical protein